GLRLELLWTPPGSGDEESQIIRGTYELGEWIKWRIEFDDGIARFLLDDEINAPLDPLAELVRAPDDLRFLVEWIKWRIEFDDGIARFLLDDEIVWQEHNMGTDGCYFKAGCYNQANTDPERGGCEPGDYFEVHIMAGTLKHWHTGWALPSTPVFTG